MQSHQLPTESQVFEDEVLTGAKSTDYPPEEMPERHDHGTNIIGTIRIQLFAKSFILQMYDVLARHTSRERKTLTNQTRKCRSDTIMARILAENPNPAFRQVIHSAGVRRFGEAQAG